MNKRIIEKKEVNIALIVILFILVIAHCFFESYSYTVYSDFNAINGTFQNYNVVRRFLSGQIPYKDFYPYLGLGHLVWGSLFTAIFGGSFGDSVFAFDFLSSLIVFLLIYILSVTVTKNKFGTIAYYLSFIIYGIYIFIINIAYNLHLTSFTYRTGNSARFIRGGALLAFVLMELVMLSVFEKKIQDKKIRIISSIIGTSVVSGIILPWGNDYGLACFLCAMLFTVFIVIVKTKSASKAVLSFLSFPSIGGLSAFITVTLITKGHFYEWVRQNFILKSYQNWYFNDPHIKTYYLYEIDLSVSSLIALELTLFYLLMYIRKKEEKESLKRYGLLAFLNMTCFATTNEYKLLSGDNTGIYEVLTVVMISSVLIEICFLIFKLINHTNIASRLLFITSLGAVCCLLIFSIVMFYVSNKTKKTNCYFEHLDGCFATQYDDLVNTYDFVKGKKVYSEYASAVEVSTGQFQPSGTDYIIHCLNDEDREKYLNSFHEADFDYVTTIKENYSTYGYWIRNANWFFIREVFSDYHIVWENSYEYFWELNTNKSDSIYVGEIVVNVIKIDDQNTEITVDALSVEDGIADVYIDYSARKKDGINSLLALNCLVGIAGYDHQSNYIDCWGIRPQSCEYIPIEIHNGKGKVVLTSLPEDSTELSVNEVSCSRVFLTPYYQ